MLHLLAPLLALALPSLPSLPSLPDPVTVVFALNTLAAVFSAINVISQRNPVYCALFLVANFFCLAVYYLLLDAQFLAAVQIIVYAGAIMVLFLFVVTLLAPGREEVANDRLRVLQIPAVLLGVILGGGVAVSLMFNDIHLGLPPDPDNASAQLGTVQIVGSQLFQHFLFPFEITSLLLLVAMLGAVVLAKRRIQ